MKSLGRVTNTSERHLDSEHHLNPLKYLSCPKKDDFLLGKTAEMISRPRKGDFLLGKNSEMISHGSEEKHRPRLGHSCGMMSLYEGWVANPRVVGIAANALNRRNPSESLYALV
jgi:hypothetical protein